MPAGRCSTRMRFRWDGLSQGTETTETTGFEGCRVASAIGTYLHGPLLPRNPVLADWLLSRALEHAGAHGTLEPLDDELERLAHDVSAGRARSRGGR